MSQQDDLPWTYTPTDLEMVYLTESLGPFFEDEWLSDILYKVRVGKEATCYCCRAHPDTGMNLVAAKVYRPRQFRAMRNDSYYRIGRTLTTGGKGAAYRGRVLRALKKHTGFGKKVEMLSWSSNEYHTLARLHELGADVPKPLASSQSAILMEYLGDETQGAPTLHMVALDGEDAQRLFEQVIGNITVMLRECMVHADLSAHNILWWDGQIRVIDLPQTILVDKHPGALELLMRDVDRVCQYFSKQGVHCSAGDLAIDLWRRFQQGEL